MKSDMKNTLRLFAVAVLLLFLCDTLSAQTNKWTAKGVELATPASTHKFAERDTTDLYLDFYPAAEGKNANVDGGKTPTVIFAFGGGFTSGNRYKPHYRQWIKLLNDNGFAVFSIDYRLGLKGVDAKGLQMIGAVRKAVEIGVEDMFSATSYVVKNADSFGVDKDNIIVSGSSAGAIIALQSEYELCNHSELASGLPSGFRYSGVVSFSGAIYSVDGKVKYAETPAPQLLLHGTADRVVTYKSIHIFKLGLFGSSKIASRLAKFGYPYTIIRYKDHTHDIADLMYYTFPEQLQFLKQSIINKTGRTVDIEMDDPALPVDNTLRTLRDLYGK